MEGRRVEKKPGGSKKGWIIAGSVLILLAAAYLGLCIWVGMSGKILPNVNIAGVDVSNLTKAQAQTLLESSVAQRGEEACVELRYRDWSAKLTGQDIAPLSYISVERAAEVGRENLLLQGFAYIRHLLGEPRTVDLVVEAAPEQRDELLAMAQKDVAGEVVQAGHQVRGERLYVTKGVTGVVVDRAGTEAALNQGLADAFAQVFQGAAGMCAVELPVQETPPAQPDFEAIHRELYTQVKGAQVDPVTFAVSDHVVGVDFDVDVLRAEYDGAKEGATFSIPLAVTQPKETKEGLEAKLFADLLAQASIRVGGTANRKTNVALSAEACNGVVLMPGEEFSYNNTTGSRSPDKGYLPAPIYVGGKSEDDVGGGICQTSSTIYYAVLHTTLEIVERHDHKFAVGYVPDGMDATVFYGSLDFRFKNNTNYPVKIVTESYDKNGSRYLTVKIYGTNEDGRYAVPERVQSEWVTPTVAYEPDETVPQGTLVLDTQQNAYTGVKAQTYRYIYEQDGTLVEKQDLGLSKYDMRPHLYRYNPLDGDPATWVDGKPPVPGAPAEPTPAPAPTPETDPATPVPEPGAEGGVPVIPVPVDPNDPEAPTDPAEPPAV